MAAKSNDGKLSILLRASKSDGSLDSKLPARASDAVRFRLLLRLSDSRPVGMGGKFDTENGMLSVLLVRCSDGVRLPCREGAPRGLNSRPPISRELVKARISLARSADPVLARGRGTPPGGGGRPPRSGFVCCRKCRASSLMWAVPCPPPRSSSLPQGSTPTSGESAATFPDPPGGSMAEPRHSWGTSRPASPCPAEPL